MRFSFILSLAGVSALVIPQATDQAPSNDRHMTSGPVLPLDTHRRLVRRQPTFELLTSAGDGTHTAGDDMLTRWLSAWRKLHGLPTESVAMPWTSPSSPSSPAKPITTAAPHPASTPSPVKDDNNNSTSTDPPSYLPLPETPSSTPDPDPATPSTTQAGEDDQEQSTTPPAEPAPSSHEKRESAKLPGFVPTIPVTIPTASIIKTQSGLPNAVPSGTDIGSGALVGNIGTGLAKLMPGPLGGGLDALLKGVGSDIQAGKKPPKLQRVQPVQPTVATSFPSSQHASLPLINT
ncbi:protein of unknown function [Taphrina deformans PYCC 5710]|uniref:Uncharacterized protein n=1 Tax=Taphrina deformans (strain PYCC 5710 / ATCC 11124 / CBS 356.35 / IMI 108563 / JCM 9778 / NBRC 8474) TaxID=1097556 RepID=R4X7G8_TAPDE|nr:protein of unknown function [Taphrina deformans PYCC 5710]|eukprot:CCG81346.1 protein of unknown function [Taphrina deformans PYCC 5710]